MLTDQQRDPPDDATVETHALAPWRHMTRTLGRMVRTTRALADVMQDAGCRSRVMPVVVPVAA